jgi:hypothetical protein
MGSLLPVGRKQYHLVLRVGVERTVHFVHFTVNEGKSSAACWGEWLFGSRVTGDMRASEAFLVDDVGIRVRQIVIGVEFVIHGD